MDKKEKFYNILNPFFENGLMYEIHSSDEISVCNLANEDYCIFRYDTIEQFGQVIGVLFNKEVISDIINNNDKWYIYLKKVGKKYLDENMFCFNSKMYDLMLNIKNENDIKGPSKVIDLDWEERIKNRSKSL